MIVNIPQVLDLALAEFKLDATGPHGLSHWLSVMTAGVDMAQLTGADIDVVVAFALLHDMCREDDGYDPLHGERAAALIPEMGLMTGQVELLTEAIQHHSAGRTHENPTIGTCWDADRVDLPRVGVDPMPQLMSTKPGKYWAEHGSLDGYE